MALPSQEGTVARVPIDFRIKQKQVSGDATVETDVFVRHELGGSASLRYSMDGRTWSDAITTTNASNQKEQTLRVVIPAAELADGSMLHVRVELVAAAGVKTKIASRLDELRIGRVYKDILAVNAAE